MKNKTHLHIWAEKIIKKTGFVFKKEISRGYYYTKDKIRSLIIGGLYKNKPAVFKIYDDPRLTDEPIAVKNFNKSNKSKIIKAPKVYKYEVVSPKKGWFIMEKMPEGSKDFKRPIKPEDRKLFAKLYLEYRKNFSAKPARSLTLSENLPAHQFHIFRINRWFQLANNKEAERVMSGQKPILNPREFIPRFEKGLDLIRQEFKQRKMVWCHGHFNPAEIFKHPKENIYYLTDFMHSKMYPEGYELSFIIWSDWIMHADCRMSYLEWKKGIDSWVLEFKPIVKKLKVKRFNSLMRASLVERSIGAILADICATDGPRQEKIKRINLIYKLLDNL
jgi:hypothetical protein